MSQIATCADELAAIQAVANPILAALNEAPFGTPEHEALDRAHDHHWPRILNLTEAIARGRPETPREALALALVNFDFAFDVANGACDTTGNALAAAKALVRHLADLAGVEPQAMGLFRPRLKAAGLLETYDQPLPQSDLGEGLTHLTGKLKEATTMHTTTEAKASGTGAKPGAVHEGAAEVARRANLDDLRRRRDAAEDGAHTAGFDSPDAVRLKDEVDTLDEQISDSEIAILAAPVIDDRDALAVAITVAFLTDQGIAEDGTFRLLEYLAKRAGLIAADVRLAHYWAVVHEAPALRARATALEAMEQAQQRRTLRAHLEVLRAAVPAGNLMAVRCGTWVDFYGEDARFVSATLGIVLNQRRDGEGGTVALCGVPLLDFDRRRPAIEAAGHQVTVVDAAAAQRA